MSDQHTQSVGKEGLYTLPSPGVPGWRRRSSRVSLKANSGTGAYACTEPVLGFPAASTSEDGFLRAQSSSLTGRGCAAIPPQPRNVRLPRQVRPRGRSVMGARRVLKRDKIRMCLDAAPRVISLSSFSLQAVPAAARKAREVRACPGRSGRLPSAQALSGPLTPPQQRTGCWAPS